MELMQAHRQWATRPQDQRFQSFDALYDAVAARAERSFHHDTDLTGLVIQPTNNGDIQISRDGRKPASMTNWSFNQLARLTNSPVEFLRSLRPETAATVLNERIIQTAARRDPTEQKIQVFYEGHNENSATVRAFTSVDYGRALDRDYLNLIRTPIQAGGWQLPLGYENGKWGAPMVPSGAYAGDRDMFLFMVDYSRPIEVRGETLFRGFFTWNSEVGSKSWAFMAFLFRACCGNNIVWGAQDINLVRIYHRGENTMNRIDRAADKALVEYSNQNTAREVSVISAAMDKNVASNDAEAVTWLRNAGFAKGVSEAAVGAANKEEGGAGTLWQLVQGLTAYARSIPHTDSRNELERDAGKLLELVN
jgi:hypothetical protein